MMISGCVQYQPKKEKEEEPSEFDYSTLTEISLKIDYKFEAVIPFQIFTEDPIIYSNTSSKITLRTDINPIAAGFTNNLGIYSNGKVEIPAYVKTLYIYSPAFYAQTLIVATVSGKEVSASAEVPEVAEAPQEAPQMAETKAPKSTSSFVGRPAITDWKCWLGTVNSNNGRPNYLLTGDDTLNISKSMVSTLYRAMASVINRGSSCPEMYRAVADMLVVKDAEVAVTMLGGNTCWNNSLGYYYYKEGNKPQSLNDVEIIALFPNTQDGYWSQSGIKSVNSGIRRGDAAQLIFYPNIASGSKEGSTKIFPAGYKIGFVIATNGWDGTNSRNDAFSEYGWVTGTRYYASSTVGLSSQSQYISGAHTALFSYGDYNMICFEDYRDDDNFSDVAFCLRSNPVDAIGDIVVVDTTSLETYATTGGIYAFEDNWPKKGDYDMNDVLATCYRTTYINSDNQITREFVTIEPFTNYAVFTNGISYVIDVPVSDAVITDSVKVAGSTLYMEAQFSKAADMTANGTIFRLTNDVKRDKLNEYRITLVYNSPISSRPDGRVFVNRGDREIHIPFEAPTSQMNTSYFGTEDDKTVWTQRNFYSSTGNYPFGIFLSNATENDLIKLLNADNEKIPIDQLYPKYSEWVTSNGTLYPNWYKE